MYVCMYVTGTSQATILALSAARVKLFGTDVRKIGIRDLPEIRVYVSSDVHSCINKGYLIDYLYLFYTYTFGFYCLGCIVISSGLYCNFFWVVL